MCCVLPGCNNATCAVAVLPLDDSEGEASELAVAPGEFPTARAPKNHQKSIRFDPSQRVMPCHTSPSPCGPCCLTMDMEKPDLENGQLFAVVSVAKWSMLQH